jgi:hypothetical protein
LALAIALYRKFIQLTNCLLFSNVTVLEQELRR